MHVYVCVCVYCVWMGWLCVHTYGPRRQDFVPYKYFHYYNYFYENLNSLVAAAAAAAEKKTLLSF